MNMQIKIMSTKLHKLEIILCKTEMHNNLAFHNTTKYTYLSGKIIHQLATEEGCSTQP
jgi:hypothetical protein